MDRKYVLQLPEFMVADEASRHLEAGDPQRALRLLREIRLREPQPPRAPEAEAPEVQRLRSYIEKAIDEIEVAYPGHALRTLRIAVGRAPLG